jgi:KUP system potassium uptake protein
LIDQPRPVPPPASRGRLLPLSLLALGVVYGDIGTSPLYALRECFHGGHAVPLSTANVLGVLSLIFWTLVVVVTLKYHVYVIRFDNRGEGGILALLGLLGQGRRRGHLALAALGVFGAALLYGDGMITPAISVLSAIEGLAVATPFFRPWIVPISIAILVLLFMVQKRGTAGVGKVFGPVTLAWFAVLGAMGVRGILLEPSVLRALDPRHAIAFFYANGVAGFLVLGAVFLVATGGEALYADLGHFGESPIQLDWFLLVGPALVLQYFGQGALLLTHPEAAVNPFYLLAPPWALYPLVALATAATIIASQAIISGAFSLTRQAMQLGLLPRMRVVHTSAAEMGQIYMPTVNWALAVATILLVAGFRNSSNLAGAYGVAVSTTMLITTLLAAAVARRVFGWRPLTIAALTAAFLVADLAFLAANYVKVVHGGWFPLLIAASVFLMMTTWEKGRAILSAKLRQGALPPATFVESLKAHPPVRVPGTAVFMHRTPDAIPSSLLHSLKHYKALHERVILLTIETEEVARLGSEATFRLEDLGEGLHTLIARYGYMESVDVPSLLAETAARYGLSLDLMQTTYFLGRETLVVTGRQRNMRRWRAQIFASMMKNAESAARFFHLPANRVVELGAQIEL